MSDLVSASTQEPLDSDRASAQVLFEAEKFCFEAATLLFLSEVAASVDEAAKTAPPPPASTATSAAPRPAPQPAAQAAKPAAAAAAAGAAADGPQPMEQ
eukprot:m.72000 g.72000  ORF g.72000 m.72000 type:complete len:99 (-) comp7975_c0_seq2:3199-3495(-)